jgi:hypothetical protein
VPRISKGKGHSGKEKKGGRGRDLAWWHVEEEGGGVQAVDNDPA